VIPLKYRTDGVHIAVAAVNGYRAVEIFNPMEVVENEND
jgi:hypothetical protein